MSMPQVRYCVRCNSPFGENEYMARTDKDEYWHLECFVCSHCFRPFGKDNEYYHYLGRMYCEKDFRTLFAPFCFGCNNYIVGRFIRARKKTWHPNCFKGETSHTYHIYCKTCGIELKPENGLYCLKCHYKADAPVCGGCKQPIENRHIEALGKTWHPEHFVCSKCEKPFHGKKHFEINGLAYCEADYYDILGHRCHICDQVIKANQVISALNKYYCPDHFCCYLCGGQLLADKTKFYDVDFNPCCKRCYKKLPFKIRKHMAELQKDRKK